MKDCILCRAMIPFYGPDICKVCQERINERERLKALREKECEKKEN